jgi:hypothetical protein
LVFVKRPRLSAQHQKSPFPTRQIDGESAPRTGHLGGLIAGLGIQFVPNNRKGSFSVPGFSPSAEHAAS